MGDTEGRGHCQEVLELVLRTFLHLQLGSKQYHEVIEKGTDPEPAGGIWFHDFPHVPHELGEGVADLAMLDDE